MKKQLKFVWIDDDPEREKSARLLEKQLEVKCKFIDVSPSNVNYLALVDEIKPNLILVDHNLTEIGTGKIKKGSTIASLIREKHPKYAIACITGENGQGMDSLQRQSYEAVFSHDDIKANYCTMKSIADAYRKMKVSPPNSIIELLKLMVAPKNDYARIESIIPHDVKENFSDDGVFSSISNWIRSTLFERPGFLYDKLWAATFLGLNESGFKKVEELFRPAIYKGIFSDESKERWWKSKLLEILSKKVINSGLPWEKGRALPGILPRHYSKDYYSNYKEEYPEVVAFIDEVSEVRAPMKLVHTVLHPRYDKLLFFEDIRMMNSD